MSTITLLHKSHQVGEKPTSSIFFPRIIREFDEYRSFTGRVLKPPFVVIRRTSSPSDKYRASGTIVLGKKPVAVENHMIVIKPKSSTLKDCKKLLKTLKLSETNNFLNDRMRCRHLTVGVIKKIPLHQF